MTDFRLKLKKIARGSRRLVTGVFTHPAMLSGVLVAGLVLGLRHAGGLQPLELLAYDQMMRLRSEVEQDKRLLIVAITEEDIQRQNRYPISDEVVAKLIAKLQQYQPRVIGLDIYRDVPQMPGNAELLQQLQAVNVTTVMLLGDAENGGVAAPKGVTPERIGFSDLLVDPDAVVRRNLLFARTPTESFYSFALRSSVIYLAKENQSLQVQPEFLQIGSANFRPLNHNSGGYHGLDARGYQILLNYRSNTVARQVTLTQLLNGEVKPEWVKDKLVLIGTTAPSAKDLFLTPLNLSADKSPKTPGVIVHAQIISQILSTVLDGRSQIWYWTEPLEGLWIFGWALVGGGIAWRLRHPLSLGTANALGLGGLFAVCLGLFSQGGWVPFVPAAIALVITGVGVVVYRLLHDAFHDELTGFPNRALFINQLQWTVTRRLGLAGVQRSLLSRRWEEEEEETEAAAIAVLFLGLDSFKAINDSFGHRLGDQLLIATARRLKACLHASDQIARVGGDEFAILRRTVKDPEEVTQLADRLQKQLTLPFRLSGQEIFTSASVGIVLDRGDSDHQPEDILRDAHTALNRAKASGKARNEVFVTGMRVQVMTRLKLETDLRHAVERQEFQLYYQPMIALETGKVAGFEALVRWQHPHRGFVPPAEFIPIAEETDLILPLGQWVIREACCQLRLWQEQFPQDPPLLVSVNLSGKQFSQPDLVEQIEQTLEETGLHGRNLKLEITEGIAMTDVEATIALLLRLKALDLQLSIDDFGTGYSSLSYLHRFPTNTIKVDRSFVSQMGYKSE
ncbi:MAG TPA: CHASE2 domain-containing protein, partial [Thermosynechococcaceae cyanobacterium]